VDQPTVFLDLDEVRNQPEPEPPPRPRPGGRSKLLATALVLAVLAGVLLWSRLPVGAHSRFAAPDPSASASADPDPTASGTGTGPVAPTPDGSATASAAPSLYGLTATVLNADQVRIDWQTDGTGFTGWNVARNGTDDNDFGPWNTDLPAAARTHTFNILVAGFDYTFTLTPRTATGSGPPATVTANTANTAAPASGSGAKSGGAAPARPVTGTGSGTTAAEKFGWGTPLPASDEFNYTGAPDSTKWNNAAPGCGEGHNGNGLRCGGNSQVNGMALVQTGTADGATGWMGSKLDQKYGRWEARVRSMNVGTSNGRTYHPLLIIWPNVEDWPRSGEYDFLENGAPGEKCAEAFIHYPHPPLPGDAVEQEHYEDDNCGTPLSEWHNLAIDWQASGITGYIDGRPWFSVSGGKGPNGRSDIQAMPKGHLTIQLDNFYGGGLTPARYEVDWVRIYAP
jgi:hypothetical protein